MQTLLVIVLLLFCSSASAGAPSSAASNECAKPSPGSVMHACEAQNAETLYQSEHDGDRWVDCEEMSGHHGTAGYGVAVFFASEARPYWQEEIRLHLNSLRQQLSKRKFTSIQREQSKWERSLPKLISRAQRSVGREGGTLAMYTDEGNAMRVVRKRALALACAVEQSQSNVGSKGRP